MKHIVKYLEEKLRVTPLGKVTTKPYEEVCDAYVGEEILIDGQCTGIKVTYIDYIYWLESKTPETSDSEEVRIVTCACSSTIPSIMFLDKSDAIQFDKALEEFCKDGRDEWKEAASQYVSKEVVDHAINVSHVFHLRLRGACSQKLLGIGRLSINSDPYSPILNYLNGYFN